MSKLLDKDKSTYYQIASIIGRIREDSDTFDQDVEMVRQKVEAFKPESPQYLSLLNEQLQGVIFKRKFSLKWDRVRQLNKSEWHPDIINYLDKFMSGDRSNIHKLALACAIHGEGEIQLIVQSILVDQYKTIFRTVLDAYDSEEWKRAQEKFYKDGLPEIDRVDVQALMEYSGELELKKLERPYGFVDEISSDIGIGDAVLIEDLPMRIRHIQESNALCAFFEGGTMRHTLLSLSSLKKDPNPPTPTDNKTIPFDKNHNLTIVFETCDQVWALYNQGCIFEYYSFSKVELKKYMEMEKRVDLNALWNSSPDIKSES